MIPSCWRVSRDEYKTFSYTHATKKKQTREREKKTSVAVIASRVLLAHEQDERKKIRADETPGPLSLSRGQRQQWHQQWVPL